LLLGGTVAAASIVNSTGRNHQLQGEIIINLRFFGPEKRSAASEIFPLTAVFYATSDEVNELMMSGASGTPVELPTAFLSGFRRLPAKLTQVLAEQSSHSGSW
jgi:hypothetical protein